MLSSFKRTLLLLWLLIGLCVLIGGCHHGSMFFRALSTESIEKTSSQHLATGKLPENFVSVGIKTEQGAFRHLAGGFLVHPGVIMTTLYRAQEYYPGLLNLDEPSTNDLYIQFQVHDQQNSKHILYKVQDILYPTDEDRHLEDNDHKHAPDHRSGTLLVFAPTADVAHIAPLPMATIDDVPRLEDALEDPLYAVGISRYSKNLPLKNDKEQNICPDNSFVQLAKVRSFGGSKEYAWLLDMIHIFPGKLKPFLLSSMMDQAMQREGERKGGTIHHDIEMPTMDDSLKHGFFEHVIAAGQCTKGRICTEGSHWKDEGYLQFQCAEHIGYPLLWESPTGEKKALAMSWLSQYAQGFPPKPKRLDAVHFDMVLIHPWLRKTLGSYRTPQAQNKDQSFIPDQKILSALDDFLPRNKTHRESPHPGALVSLAEYHGEKIGYQSFCRGVLIHPGVVLTAAHCLIRNLDNQHSRVQIIFKHSPETDIVATATKLIAHPQHDQEDMSYLSPLELADIGLVFFESTPQLSKIPPAVWLRDDRTEIARVVAGERQLWSVSTQNLEDTLAYRKLPHAYKEYRHTSFHTASNVQDYVTQKTTQWHQYSSQQKQRFFALSGQITGQTVDEKLFLKALPELYGDKKYLAQARECEEPFHLCVWGHKSANRLEQATSSCAGDSGAPLFASPAPPNTPRQGHSQTHPTVLGILTQGSSYGRNVYGCSQATEFMRVSGFYDWIDSHIKTHASANKQ